MNTIAIQGQSASFHDIATRKFFGEDFALLSCDTFVDTFEALLSGKSDYAVVAVENSLYGTINPVFDLLQDNKVWVCGEVYLRIEHCLIGVPGAELKDIVEVHSQIMAIGQCEDWLRHTIPSAKHVEEHDTTASVVMVKDWGDRRKAAIASQDAAELHNMQILHKNIEDHHENYTRFFVLHRTKEELVAANKTSLVFSTRADMKPGSLYRALGVFANHNINVFALHARPIVGKAWHYMFYVDIAIGTTNPIFMTILEELKSQGCEITVLGSYINGMN